MFLIWRSLIWIDVKAIFSKISLISNSLIFFIIISAIYPLTISHDYILLTKIAPGIIIINLLIILMINISNLLQQDYQNGFLEQLAITHINPYQVMLAKIISLWVLSALPLVLITPIIAVFYGLSIINIICLILIITMASMIFTTIAFMGSLLTINQQQNHMLTILITAPLNISSIIFSLLVYDQCSVDASMSNIYNYVLVIIAQILIFLPISCFFGVILLKNLFK